MPARGVEVIRPEDDLLEVVGALVVAAVIVAAVAVASVGRVVWLIGSQWEWW